MSAGDLIYRLITKNGKRTSDYQYNVLENSHILHDAETLKLMYNNASNNDQKASIMLHIDNFHDITDDWNDYRKIRNKIWDDFTC